MQSVATFGSDVPAPSEQIAVARTLPADLRLLSVVVPVYGAPESLDALYRRVRDVARGLGVAYELILVDDRCPRNSWSRILKLVEADTSVVAIRLSRNFGQHPAIEAGLRRARGDWIVVMDCDLQDRPEEIPNLLRAAARGADVVRARRAERQDAFFRRAASRLFYGMLGYLTATPRSAAVANFGAYRRKVIDAILAWHEETKYFPAIIQWAGFDVQDVEVAHDARVEGRSGYNLAKLIALASNVAIGFSDRPLRLLFLFGLTLSFVAFVAALVLVIAHFVGAFEVEGWTSLMVSIWFLGGAVLSAVGLTGLYVGRILIEAKGRPVFIVDEEIDRRACPTSVERP